jgi:MFS transporter, DHA2 family, multidrug resistance protein
MLRDPPYLARMRQRLGRIDLTGIALIAAGLGCLEVVLDKGQEDNWFESSTIVGFALTAAIALVSFVLWERKQERPIVDVRMFKDRNFATSNVMMLVLGVALYGSTVLLPQYLQLIMGYSAQQAGMALSPGGFVVILLMPLVGTLIARVDARLLIGFGFVVLSASMFYMSSHLYPGMDFRTAIKLRAFQSVGLAFLFVPINTLIYAGLPPQKNNAVSGIVNLSRNLGGDVGIAFVTMLIARRSQFHQSRLASHTTPYDLQFRAALDGMARSLEHAGASSAEATRRAMALMYRQFQGQVATLAYIDALKILGLATAAMIPLLLLARKPASTAAPSGH